MTWDNSTQPICGWKLRLIAAWQNTTQLRTPSHTSTVSLPRQEPLQVAFWFPGSFRQSSRSSAAIHAPLSCPSPASPLGKKLSTQGQVRERSGYFFLPRSSAARLTSTVSRLLGFLQGPQDQTIRQIQEGQDSEIFKLNRILNVFFSYLQLNSATLPLRWTCTRRINIWNHMTATRWKRTFRKGCTSRWKSRPMIPNWCWFLRDVGPRPVMTQTMENSLILSKRGKRLERSSKKK